MQLDGKGNEEVVMPSVVDNNGDKIPGLRIQKQFEKAIMRGTVPKVLIADGTEMKFPCYILDYNEVKETSIFEQEAIRSMLVPDTDDVQIYIRLNDKVFRVGASNAEKMDTIVDLFKNYCADENCKVYKCDTENKKVEIKKRDITKIRLSL